MSIIKIEHVYKSFGQIKALADLSLEVNSFELFGIIGPDGAGKTTLFRLLTSLLLPDNGKIEMLGKDSTLEYKELRKHVGYMPGKFSLYPDLSVKENIDFFARIFGTTLEANYDLIAPIYSQIERFKNRKAAALSGGMKQKLALSCALIHKPEILLLDEPTTGVDAVSRKEFWEMLKELQHKKITILVSTPYMDEATMCNRIALLQKGKLLSVNTPANITKTFTNTLFSIKAKNKYLIIKTLENYEYVNSVFSFGQNIHYTDKRENISIEELRKFLATSEIEIDEISIIEPNIEDVFMEKMTINNTMSHAESN